MICRRRDASIDPHREGPRRVLQVHRPGRCIGALPRSRNLARYGDRLCRQRRHVAFPPVRECKLECFVESGERAGFARVRTQRGRRCQNVVPPRPAGHQSSTGCGRPASRRQGGRCFHTTAIRGGRHRAHQSGQPTRHPGADQPRAHRDGHRCNIAGDADEIHSATRLSGGCKSAVRTRRRTRCGQSASTRQRGRRIRPRVGILAADPQSDGSRGGHAGCGPAQLVRPGGRRITASLRQPRHHLPLHSGEQDLGVRAHRPDLRRHPGRHHVQCARGNVGHHVIDLDSG